MKLKKLENTNKSRKIVIVIAVTIVLILPMLYASIYLGSVWDAYSKLDQVPVAFVNLDKSFTKDGKEYALGKEVENKLKNNNKVGWRFVSKKEAIDGVNGTKYYAMIEIPEDFSKNIASANDGIFKTAEINYMANKGRNFIFSQISSHVAENLKTTVSSSIQKEISKVLLDNLFDIKVSMKAASDGAGKLQHGVSKILEGSKKIETGVGAAANGSVQLKNGLRGAVDTTGKLKGGTQKLLSGSMSLKNGLKNAATGSKQLLNGVKTISSGQSQLANGSSALVDGLKSLKSNLIKPNDQVSLLVNGASELNNKAEAIAQGAAQLDTSVSTLVVGMNQIDSVLHDELDAIGGSNLSQMDKAKLTTVIAALDQVSNTKTKDGEAPLTKATNSLHQLAGNLQQLKGVTALISNGVSGLATGLTEIQHNAAVGVDQLMEGAQGIQKGSQTILVGLNTVANKTGQLTNGLEALNRGATSLGEGMKAVNAGTIGLESGLSTAAKKTGELSVGLKTLNSGVNSLSQALDTTKAGATKLKYGLGDGYVKMNSKLKFSSDKMSQFVSEPVTLKDNSINDVKRYGEGLAPYFISLSLWIGAMVLNIVFLTVKKRKIFQSKFMNSYWGEFIVSSIIVVLQALIVSIVLTHGLGVKPPNAPVLYLTNIVFSMVFFSIFYGVSEVIGDLATPVMFLVLLLQLASSGGTFPIESAPTFYGVINHVVPMTYSVSTLRMTISGINQSTLNQNLFAMMIFMVVFLGGGYLIRTVINMGKRH